MIKREGMICFSSASLLQVKVEDWVEQRDVDDCMYTGVG
jgi:hypothetical protein